VVERFSDAFTGVYQGDVENDGFNRLVLEADLDWRQAMTLRALCRYLIQLRIPFSQAYIENTLSSNNEVAKALVEYFEARFDPYRERDEGELNELKANIENLINKVSSLDEDRILSLYLSVISATLRTNYFQKDEKGELPSYLVIKLSPGRHRRRSEAPAQVRNLRLCPLGRGRSPARRQGRARRTPLVRPAGGFPHRGPGPDEGADGEKRGDRSGGRQGRLRGQAAAA
jgi:hypothetical protein